MGASLLSRDKSKPLFSQLCQGLSHSQNCMFNGRRTRSYLGSPWCQRAHLTAQRHALFQAKRWCSDKTCSLITACCTWHSNRKRLYLTFTGEACALLQGLRLHIYKVSLIKLPYTDLLTYDITQNVSVHVYSKYHEIYFNVKTKQLFQNKDIPAPQSVSRACTAVKRLH